MKSGYRYVFKLPAHVILAVDEDGNVQNVTAYLDDGGDVILWEAPLLTSKPSIDAVLDKAEAKLWAFPPGQFPDWFAWTG